MSNNSNSNPDEAPMPGAWVTSDEKEEFIPGWNSDQKKLLPDEESEGPYEHPEVPEVFQYVYKQSLVSFFERLNVTANPSRGSIIEDKDIFLREQAIDYNDHEPLTVINNGAVIRTSKSALQKSRMDRLQEDRDYEERERGAFRGRGRGRGGRGRGRDRAGGFSRVGRDDGGNANEIALGDRRPRTSSSSSRARSRSPLLPRRGRVASYDSNGGWARPKSPPRLDRGHRSREDSRSSRHESSGSDTRERRESWSRDRSETSRDRTGSFESERRKDSCGSGRRESFGGDRRDSYGENRRPSFRGDRGETYGEDRRSYRGDKGGEGKDSFGRHRKDSFGEVFSKSEEGRKSLGGGVDRRESSGSDRSCSYGRDGRRTSLRGFRDSLGGKDSRDSCGVGKGESSGRASDRPRAPGTRDPSGDSRGRSPLRRDSSSHGKGQSEVMVPPLPSPASSTGSRPKISYAEYKKMKEMERQRSAAR